MAPPDRLQPVRRMLGAVLHSAGQYAEAEAVYREDLVHWPENGWSLYGLTALPFTTGKYGHAYRRATCGHAGGTKPNDGKDPGPVRSRLKSTGLEG